MAVKAPSRVFLWGPMGAGKSAVGRALGALWDTPSVDLDERVQERTGRSPADWIRKSGLAAFRAEETRALEELLKDASVPVVSLGGGALLDRALRHRTLEAGVVITLDASVQTLLERTTSTGERPLLEGDSRANLEGILRDREAAYAECHARIDTERSTPEQIARQVVQVAEDAPVAVPLGTRTYRVEVGFGIRDRLVERVGQATGGDKVILVTDEGVLDPWATAAQAALDGAGRYTSVMVCLPQGEAHKHVASVERIWDAGLGAGIDRQSLVVAVGGGVVGDMAGFAAATLMRGLPFAQLPTTLLAMVDSAVGGKTGFDRPQGKNLVGAFHQPRFVLCDVEMLSTLPVEERRAGLAEVVKSAWLDGEASVQMLEQSADALAAGEAQATARAVRMSVALKAGVVTRDEHESGERALLNLGHTLGHAIEAATGYTGLRHGEAVALGMVAAFRVAERLGQGDPSRSARMVSLLQRLGLPTQVDGYLDDRTLAFVGSDKKRSGTGVRFILPGEPGETRIVPLGFDELARLALP